jgi:hypothetical protein
VAADFTKALKNASEIELTTTGRVTGRESSRPVWFVQEDGRLFLLPVAGSASQWYKNLLQKPALKLAAAGAQYAAKAKPITDSDQVGQVVSNFRAKYGAQDVAEYYPDPEVAIEVPLA